MLLAVSILSTIIAGGCTKKTSTDTAKVTNKNIRMLTWVTGGKDAASMKAWQEALSKTTGLNVTMEKPASDYNNVLMQKLQSGEKYDLIYFDQSQLPNLVDQGVLTDLTTYIKNSKTLSDPNNVPKSEWDAIKINGKIYASFNKREVEQLPNVNSVIAGKAGIDISKIQPTLDGYYSLFQKEKAYNDSTSKITGFYPLNILFYKLMDLQPWFSSIGIKEGIVVSNGKRTVPVSTDAAAPVWQWLNKCYKEGLLDPDFITDQDQTFRNKYQSGKTGVVVDWAAWTGLYNSNAGSNYPNNFKSVPMPGTKTQSGTYMLNKGPASLWAIPKNATNVQGAMKILNYFASPEGGILLSLGVEGYDYTKSGSTYTLTDKGKTAAMDHGAPFPISLKFKNPIGNAPGDDEAISYIKYASIQTPTQYSTQYIQIVSKYGGMIIKGSVSISDGLKQMRNELQQAQVTN